MIELTKTNSKIVFKLLPQDDPVKRKPVIDIAKEMLGWESIISLDAGLKNTISYFKSAI